MTCLSVLKSLMNIPKMQIVGNRLTGSVNILQIGCPCGHTFDHRADRKTAQCPKCRRIGDCMAMKQVYPVRKRV